MKLKSSHRSHGRGIPVANRSSQFKKSGNRPNPNPSKPMGGRATDSSKQSATATSAQQRFLQGQVKRHPDGFGFFIPDKSELPDVYIPRHSMKGIMSNDRVMVDVTPEPGGDRFRGEVIRIVKRETESVVGTFHRINDKTGMLRDEGKAWGQELYVDLSEALRPREGDLVSVQILHYPDNQDDRFTGKIKEILGATSDPLTDVKRVLVSGHIPHEFSIKVEGEAKQFPEEVAVKDMANRKDLRALNFITIDGATAKDFDDAIYVETGEHGFRLWVAIADVAHYVREGTAIDKEAYARGTSVYFPNFVVPMLPEVLSNGLCSLNPHVPRLTMVAEMQFDFTGVMKNADFYPATIQSKARVTYGEAQEVIEANGDSGKLRHVEQEIRVAADLAKILMAKRFRDGSLDLEIPEVQIVLDGGGNTIDMIKSERLFAHRLIEEMMLAANIAVAKFFHEKKSPGLYRIHEEPKKEMLELLSSYLKQFGADPRLDGGKLQKKLTRALQEFSGRPESQVLNILALRSMNQAKYSSGNVGHFGLGFEFYTHFTSPIRRYPDLIVHRILKRLIQAPGSGRTMGEDELTSAGTMLSACEQRAVKAERQFISIKKARFMEQHIGQEFDGVISSVAKFGIFVLLRAFEVDGLVRVENLSREKMQFDEEKLWLVGQRSGLRFAIGDSVRIKVAGADPVAGQVDFELAKSPNSGKAAAPVREKPNFDQRRKKPKGAKKSHSLRQKTKNWRKKRRKQ